ncbi:integration host factor [Candidatus Berkelbacteria bacterium CG10_big_fil_rev_8_21_14_0_10_43_13]|uniref:Integration host factor n=1 Tax=Candidatus Berkelbacteria bacterium CG10_big_fil_rev_8_21_14_0_10_43_13 TaxID=1974514 RepID=A0A2H0W6V9_9BACT|nr:MAG: integration host factor [Candidatus Berkelbacteria bacterium CG10_big_fil_rev_8_21_14_0_10_43_13]
MNKNELIMEVARKTGLSRRESEVGVQTMLDLIAKSLVEGEKITLTGFGTFDVGVRRERAGVNPRNGKPIKIPATKMPRFKPSKNLKVKVK